MGKRRLKREYLLAKLIAMKDRKALKTLLLILK